MTKEGEWITSVADVPKSSRNCIKDTMFPPSTDFCKFHLERWLVQSSSLVTKCNRMEMNHKAYAFVKPPYNIIVDRPMDGTNCAMLLNLEVSSLHVTRL